MTPEKNERVDLIKVFVIAERQCERRRILICCYFCGPKWSRRIQISDSRDAFIHNYAH